MSISKPNPRVGILMGSASDWPTVEHVAKTLDELGVAYEAKVMSAHRTPDDVLAYASAAEGRGLQVMICAAGGSAHLAGVVSAKTLLPVLGIPIKAWSLDGLDSLLSTVQMPGGVPVGTLAIGKAGAVNAALLAVAIMARSDSDLRERYARWREAAAEKVRSAKLPPGDA
jgi:5-(carboxyamino)imidazole ribonucleotide mutase